MRQCLAQAQRWAPLTRPGEIEAQAGRILSVDVRQPPTVRQRAQVGRLDSHIERLAGAVVQADIVGAAERRRSDAMSPTHNP